WDRLREIGRERVSCLGQRSPIGEGSGLYSPFRRRLASRNISSIQGSNSSGECSPKSLWQMLHLSGAISDGNSGGYFGPSTSANCPNRNSVPPLGCTFRVIV